MASVKNAPYEAKDAARNSLKKLKTGDIKGTTSMMSKSEYKKVETKVKKTQQKTGGIVKTEVKDNKYVITKVEPK
jgi:hypothetical protein